MGRKMNYILCNLTISDDSLRRIIKTLKYQDNNIKFIKASILIAYLCSWVNYTYSKELEKQIRDLKTEIEELKGEHGMND